MKEKMFMFGNLNLEYLGKSWCHPFFQSYKHYYYPFDKNNFNLKIGQYSSAKV
jgi:hypothetical protein